MATNKPKFPATAKLSSTRLLAAKQLPLGNDFVLLNLSGKTTRAVKASEQAQVLVTKAALALKSPGIPRAAVFRGAKPQKVFAYSALLEDSSKVVRESADGTRRIGTIGADGKFRLSSVPKKVA